MSIILGAFQLMNPNGTIGTSWRHPETTSADYLTVKHWTRLGRQLEEGGFDFLFFADSYGYPSDREGRTLDQAILDATNIPMADPITLVSAIAAATERLGIVVTTSTQVELPPAVARRYGTLDHLTHGRIGWNVVTGAAQNSLADLFGEPMLGHDDRYARAREHVDICLRLWEGSWAPDALIADKAAGVYADPARVRAIHYDGDYLSSHGIYGLPPGPQRTPLLLQAGSSAIGREFAARFAEVVFVGAGDIELLRSQIADIREKAVAFGRSPDAIRFLVGAHFTLAATPAEAEAKRADMLAYATLEQAATMYAWGSGYDLRAFPLDEPTPELHTETGQSALDRLNDAATGRRRTPREVLEEFRDRGINGIMFVGDGPTVADEVEIFLEKVGADGFLVQPHVTPGTYDDIITHLVPELRRRGLMAERDDLAAPTTLRKRLFGSDLLPDDHIGATVRFDH
jgi:FMN-dependent oxidoreductase (nitrilotriacetate monooxygenase family)